MYGKWYVTRHVLLDDTHPHTKTKREEEESLRQQAYLHHAEVMIWLTFIALFIILCIVAA